MYARKKNLARSQSTCQNAQFSHAYMLNYFQIIIIIHPRSPAINIIRSGLFRRFKNGIFSQFLQSSFIQINLVLYLNSLKISKCIYIDARRRTITKHDHLERSKSKKKKTKNWMQEYNDATIACEIRRGRGMLLLFPYFSSISHIQDSEERIE